MVLNQKLTNKLGLHKNSKKHRNIYPHTGVQSSLYVRTYVYMYVCMSLCLYVSLSSHRRRFLAIIKARPVIEHSTCGHRPRGQIPWVAVEYVHLYACPVVRGPFVISVLVLIPKMGSKGTQWGPVYLVCKYVCPSVSISVRNLDLNGVWVVILLL